MSKKQQKVKAWGVFKREDGSLLTVFPTRANARTWASMPPSDVVRKVEIRILPNAGNRKSA